jgi:3-hydroxy-9,10-secoandrosta-1,3,5(10)-triene-9,17-dione monooxygenase
MNASARSAPVTEPTTGRPPTPSFTDLVKRAEDLRPLLLENAAESERARRSVDVNIAAISKAGLFRLMVPRRYGGFEGTLRSHIEVSAALAEACGGTAWVVALINVCNWFTGLFCKQAQDDVFGENPDARVAGVFAPSFETRRVEGGLIASGKWYTSSGILHADWAVVGVAERDPQGVLAAQYLALIPIDEVSVEDTWFTAGMRASGSNCIVAKEVFIPDHRLMNIIEAVNGSYPTELAEPAYRAAFMPVSALILTGPQLGMGRAALRYVIEKAPTRAIAYTSFERQTDSTLFQNQIAEAALRIDTAHLRAFRAADEVDRAAQRDEKLDYLTRARMRADTGLTITLITEAINILLSAHGAGSFSESSPMQRIWRDSNTAARHAIALPAVANELYGKALLGLENTVSLLV